MSSEKEQEARLAKFDDDVTANSPNPSLRINVIGVVLFALLIAGCLSIGVCHDSFNICGNTDPEEPLNITAAKHKLDDSRSLWTRVSRIEYQPTPPGPLDFFSQLFTTLEKSKQTTIAITEA
jgi:hypothetical protein